MFRTKNYLDWEEYKELLNAINRFALAQEAYLMSIKNI
ncbi:MAG: hypothetical protein PWR30_116 [Candidatus Woesearchaeota archaeon]|nr:hypothetical protein [Candidatus Woesearchaeota archaeon]